MSFLAVDVTSNVMDGILVVVAFYLINKEKRLVHVLDSSCAWG